MDEYVHLIFLILLCIGIWITWSDVKDASIYTISKYTRAKMEEIRGTLKFMSIFGIILIIDQVLRILKVW